MNLELELLSFGERRTKLRNAVDAAGWSENVAAARAGVISSQSLGFRAERFAAEAFGWTRVPTLLQRGDLVTPEGEYVELKNSIALGGNVMVRQIRQTQRVNWLLVLVSATDDETEIFALNRPAVEYESRDMNAAHGLRATATELAMSFPLGGLIHDRWIERYRVAKVHELYEASGVVNQAIRKERTEELA